MASFLNMFLNRKINENAANNTLNKELIRWPIVLMRILGLYHHRQDKIIFKLHPIICGSLLWFLFFKTFQAVIAYREPFGMIFVIKLILVASLFLTSINVTLIFFNHELKSKENRLYQNYFDLFGMTKNSSKIKKKLTLRLNILFMIVVIESLVNCFLTSFILFGSDSLYKTLNSIVMAFKIDLITNSTNTIQYKLFLSLVYSYLIAVTYCLFGYFLSHCLIMIELLNDFNKQFTELINTKIFASNKRRQNISIKDRVELIDKTIGDKYEFEKYRQWHLKLSDCVWSLDNCFKYYIGILIFIYAFLGYLVLYALYDRKEYKLTFKFSVLISFWYISTNFIFFLMLFVAARINCLVLFILFIYQ